MAQRSKYTPKNPREYLIARKCKHCSDEGYVSKRKGIAGTEYTCEKHIRRPSMKVQHNCTTVQDLLNLALYHSRG